MDSVQTITLPPSSGNVDPQAEEKFGHLDIKNLSFKDTWVFWESMKCAPRQNASNTFIDNNFSIFEFNNLETLSKIWRTRINKASSFFFFDGKLVWIQDSSNRSRNMEAICLFKKNIQPAWEDPQNTNGGELQNMFENIESKQELIDNIYREIIITILSDEYPFREETNGIRMVDKNREGKSKIRLEIWFNFSDNKKEPNASKIQQLKALFGGIILKYFPTTDLQFKNHGH